MKNSLIVSLVLSAFMLMSAVATSFLVPSVEMKAGQEKINLETMIPREFEGWKIDSSIVSLMVNPDSKQFLDKIYTQTLSRTYVNSEGERIMLSIAYGKDQSADLQVHRPELCYIAEGFDIGVMSKKFINTSLGRIPVMQLVAKQGIRNEPITYWIRVGDSLTRGWFEQKFTAIIYRLTGKTPDGLLFRVSNISDNEQDSYRIQQEFLEAVLNAVHGEDRYWLVGRLNP